MDKRKFIIKGIKTILTLFSPVIVHAASQDNNSRKVKMLTSDGRLVWVELKEFQKDESKAPISNQELHSWIKSQTP